MTHRERFLGSLRGKPPQRPHAVVRLDIWHRALSSEGRLPERYAGLEVEEVERALGCGRSARAARVHRVEYDGVREERVTSGDDEIIRWVTPIGELTTVLRSRPELRRAGMRGLIVKYPVASAADYRIARRFFEGVRFIADYDAYEGYDREIGDEGLPLVGLGRSPAHWIMLELTGYEQFYYDIADRPDEVKALLQVMAERLLELAHIAAASPAPFFLHGAHFGPMTPPRIFREYFLPHFIEFNDILHAAGKHVAGHTDADLSQLLDLFMEAGFDAADTFLSAPAIDLTVERALDAWQGKVLVWGGIPSVALERSFPRDEFEQHAARLVELSRTRPDVIIAVSDNVMGTSDIGRLEWLAERMKA